MAPRSAPPPTLPGLTFVEPIGTGGFADVYRYRQEFPSREVAVKVLRESSDADGVAQFRAEANVMAQLSGHPSIVPIFQADVSADGRAYLVMEYCPPPHLAERFRRERISVPDALDVGVRISSAVETAHRVGILHRDIKPHNILTSAYGAPLLTDFGIASVVHDDGAGSDAMSVPWSPPEVFENPALLDVRSDVYSLAATVYSLLAGRSPFEVPGGANDNATLISRIERQSPSSILRADVPASLNQVLLRALGRRLEDRHSSAMSFARSLQEVQIELHLPPTRLEVLDASPEARAAGAPTSDARTEVKPISIIVPDEIAERGTLFRPRSITQAEDRTGVPPRLPHPDTVHQRRPEPVEVEPPVGLDVVPDAPLDPETERLSRRGRIALVVGGALTALVVAIVLVAVVLGDSAEPPAETPSRTAPDPGLIVSGPGQPVSLTVQFEGGRAHFAWSNPRGGPDDIYLVEAGATPDGLTEVARGPQQQAAVPAPSGAQVCIAVTTLRDSQMSTPLSQCVVAP